MGGLNKTKKGPLMMLQHLAKRTMAGFRKDYVHISNNEDSEGREEVVRRMKKDRR